MSPSIPRPTKCMIKNLDTGKFVEAYFNPKELSIEKKVPWNKHKDSKANNPMLEFTDADPKELSIELLFDGFESRTDVHDSYIKTLETFTKIVEGKKRPPMCMFVWGKSFPSFMGVVESLSTKYTMFLTDGTPVRATCTVKMKEADKLTVSKDAAKTKGKKAPKADEFNQDGEITTQGETRRPDKFGDDHRAVLDASGSENGQLETGSRVPGQRG